MLGSGDTRCEDLWRTLAGRLPDRVSARIGFDEDLAHLIEAGSDLFLMPSWYEPCGLNQMYSLRYGTLPVVRATGGLQDTVTDPDESAGEATGFTFQHYTAEGLIGAVNRAIDLYRGDPGRWRAMQRGKEVAIYHEASPIDSQTRRWLREGAERLARLDGIGARASFRRAAESSKGTLPGEALAWDVTVE